MSKLTPPALQNLKRRQDFYKKHSELPEAENELKRIQAIKNYKRLDNNWKTLKKPKVKGQENAVDGAEFYRKLKEQEALDKKLNKKDNVIKRIFKIFNRVKWLAHKLAGENLIRIKCSDKRLIK